MSNEFYDSVKEAAEEYSEGAGWGTLEFNDACFIIEKGATKLPDPKPQHEFEQKFRKLPHHRKDATDPLANNTVDIPHLRNALARVSLTKTLVENQADFQARAKAHLEKHAKALLKTYQASVAKLAEVEALCAEFGISDLPPTIHITSNGPANTPYCVIDQAGKQVQCYATMKLASDRMAQMKMMAEQSVALDVSKTGTTDMPYCVMSGNKKLQCYATMQEAKDQMKQMMDRMNAGADTKVVKNGPTDKPYCVIGKSGHGFGCYATDQEAQKRSVQINNFGKK